MTSSIHQWRYIKKHQRQIKREVQKQLKQKTYKTSPVGVDKTYSS